MTYKQEKTVDYIQTYTGKRFYPTTPNPKDVDIIDIAHALSNLCRFTGHGDRFYSVGEHSLYSQWIAQIEGYTPLQQLYVLLHDASEAYCNDLARPLKQQIPQYIQIENSIMSAVWEGLGLPQPSEEDYRLIKIIDNTMLLQEAKKLMSRSDINPDHLEYYDNYDIDLSDAYLSGESKEDFLRLFYALRQEAGLELIRDVPRI